MTQLTAEQIQRAVDACQAHSAEMAEAIRATLGCDLHLRAAPPVPFSAESLSAFDAPGLAVSLGVGEQGVLILIPESLPLPASYREAGISENNRLQTFAHELSLQLIPADLQTERHAAIATSSLHALAESAHVSVSAFSIELSVHQADSIEAEPAAARILVILPVDAPPVAQTNVESPPDDADAGGRGKRIESDVEGEEIAIDAETTSPPSKRAPSIEEALRALRVLRVPVTVSVRLAERRVPLGQIVGLVPGALLTFNKSCEDLLDLFVNNHRYCQGEAVKIGENFGLRVARVGVTDERKEHVL